MARSFTLNFTFDHQSYMAVASVLQDSVCVYIPDEGLHHLLPQGRFSYDAQQGLNIDATARTPIQKLMLAVFNAIELKTQTQGAGNV